MFAADRGGGVGQNTLTGPTLPLSVLPNWQTEVQHTTLQIHGKAITSKYNLGLEFKIGAQGGAGRSDIPAETLLGARRAEVCPGWWLRDPRRGLCTGRS